MKSASESLHQLDQARHSVFLVVVLEPHVEGQQCEGDDELSLLSECLIFLQAQGHVDLVVGAAFEVIEIDGCWLNTLELL